MATWIKQSSAIEVPLGPFVDSTDSITPETGLTITPSDVRLNKAGGGWNAKNDSANATHEENGWYTVALDSTDTSTLGSLVIAVYESGALPVWREFMVVPANVYDSLVNNVEFLEVAGFAQEFDATSSPAEFYERDGTTVQFTKTLGTDPAADPIVSSS